MNKKAIEKLMIRNYENKDLPMIMDIANKAWRKIHDMSYDTYGEDLFNILVPDRYFIRGEQVKSHCDKHNDWIFICEENNEIVGFVTFCLDYKTRIGDIGFNAVCPDCGLKGIGQQMYKAVLAYFMECDMKYARVGTGLNDAHAPARRAYERAGFDIKTENIIYYMKL